MMRVVVLLSGRGSNLRALFEAIDAGRCEVAVVGVVADRSAPGLELAMARNIATAVVPLRKRDDRTAWNQQLADVVARWSPDVVALMGFMKVLGAPFLERFDRRILNVHPALLPAFPGAHGAADALAAGVRITGCTVHLVDAGVDTGDIVAQAAVPVLPDDTVDALQARIQVAEHRLFPSVLSALATGALTLSPVGWRTDAAVGSAVPSAETAVLYSPMPDGS